MHTVCTYGTRSPMAGRPTSNREVVGSSPIAFNYFFSLLERKTITMDLTYLKLDKIMKELVTQIIFLSSH